ncbi:threonine--tRNA ligase [Candidatus Wolfebacteria bacterium CG03_land_8_20_14_0_80_36_15]|uniref:Threonine--tRNA ligase n=1 Tax=Candidatus Wolfebacteria bacterium CG03_land_8_20_14_0_80_36_15 TaxID=1975067 RepID=A0A2M7B7X9_9BACT|nr:MAG: threonine--tRNA ligase [Candidatus Wolfebacteria bacterium CG03_land_8_20_14_0_80_36_15]
MKELEKIRHSLSHLMAMAVLEIYPKTKLGIGPTIENGFYYDFDLDAGQRGLNADKRGKSQRKSAIKDENLPKLEQRMQELIKQNLKFEKKIITAAEAKKIFKNQPYKLELIKELKKAKQKISIYKTFSNILKPKTQNLKPVFVDLCAGPHVKNTSEIDPDSFKLTKLAGAYWRGNEKNPMLTRIYGIAFENKKALNEYLKFLEEAEKRDHRTLGQKLELFMFDDEVGPGLPLWMPKGEIIRHLIKEYLYKELIKNGYQWVETPHLGNLALWKTSGHWELYRDYMYSPIEIEKEKYLIKPMNCPFHVKIYQSNLKSYKDLPLRYAEFGTVYRYEKSGVLQGLVRVRGFTQDDAHIWCAPEQLVDELEKILKEGLEILKTFGFKDFEIFLSTRPEKFAGTEKGWGKATKALKYVLEKIKLKYQVDPGAGVFYGPKIDIKIKDSLGRAWQCTTIQVDFNLPERFKIIYFDKNSKKQQPIMIHRALIGSLERFIGVLLEHYEGALPVWLSPIQVEIINVGSSHRQYANSVNQQLITNNIRANLSDENLTVSKRIRNAEIQKIPYILVVGDKEIKEKSVNVRNSKKGVLGIIKFEDFIKNLLQEIKNKI